MLVRLPAYSSSTWLLFHPIRTAIILSTEHSPLRGVGAYSQIQVTIARQLFWRSSSGRNYFIFCVLCCSPAMVLRSSVTGAGVRAKDAPSRNRPWFLSAPKLCSMPPAPVEAPHWKRSQSMPAFGEPPRPAQRYWRATETRPASEVSQDRLTSALRATKDHVSDFLQISRA